MLEIDNALVAKKNPILRGYAAFNDGEWDAIRELLCEDVVWHPMDGGDPIIGREPVIAHLEGLRNNAHAEAELLGVAIATDNNAAITVDFTRMTGPEGNHACADKILFDGSGLIQEVWHCSTDSRA